MLPLNQVKIGQKIVFRHGPCEVLSARHQKLGRGRARLATKLRQLLDGTVFEHTFGGDERLTEASVNYRQAQFLYADGSQAQFMTADDFQQFTLTLPPARLAFLKEGQSVDLVLWQNQAIDLKLPSKLGLLVRYTEPGFKGNTANTPQKPAKLETGTVIQVPLFIKTGDKIVVNTESGKYLGRL